MAALPQAKTSLRDVRARETRARLIEAAIALIVEQGWPNTKVEQIAERAGVAKGTFFVHFPTKEAIVLALVEKQIAKTLARRETAGGSPLERLAAATMELGAQAASNVELSRAVLIASLESRVVGGATDAVFSRLYDLMLDDAGEAVLDDQVVDGLLPDQLAGLLMACYLGATLHATSVPRQGSITDVLQPLVDAVLAMARRRGALPETRSQARTPTQTKRRRKR